MYSRFEHIQQMQCCDETKKFHWWKGFNKPWMQTLKWFNDVHASEQKQKVLITKAILSAWGCKPKWSAILFWFAALIHNYNNTLKHIITPRRTLKGNWTEWVVFCLRLFRISFHHLKIWINKKWWKWWWWTE